MCIYSSLSRIGSRLTETFGKQHVYIPWLSRIWLKTMLTFPRAIVQYSSNFLLDPTTTPAMILDKVQKFQAVDNIHEYIIYPIDLPHFIYYLYQAYHPHNFYQIISFNYCLRNLFTASKLMCCPIRQKCH